jgi:hypothetical protein
MSVYKYNIEYVDKIAVDGFLLPISSSLIKNNKQSSSRFSAIFFLIFLQQINGRFTIFSYKTI